MCYIMTAITAINNNHLPWKYSKICMYFQKVLNSQNKTVRELTNNKQTNL